MFELLYRPMPLRSHVPRRRRAARQIRFGGARSANSAVRRCSLPAGAGRVGPAMTAGVSGVVVSGRWRRALRSSSACSAGRLPASGPAAVHGDATALAGDRQGAQGAAAAAPGAHTVLRCRRASARFPVLVGLASRILCRLRRRPEHPRTRGERTNQLCAESHDLAYEVSPSWIARAVAAVTMRSLASGAMMFQTSTPGCVWAASHSLLSAVTSGAPSSSAQAR